MCILLWDYSECQDFQECISRIVAGVTISGVTGLDSSAKLTAKDDAVQD